MFSACRVSAFDFNYNGAGAQYSPLYPIGGVSEVKCTNCWAYVGATAFFVVNWEGTDLAQMEAGVSGTTGFNFELDVASSAFATSSSTVLASSSQCVPDIVLYG